MKADNTKPKMQLYLFADLTSRKGGLKGYR